MTIPVTDSETVLSLSSSIKLTYLTGVGVRGFELPTLICLNAKVHRPGHERCWSSVMLH
jgi:hypothetical protein